MAVGPRCGQLCVQNEVVVLEIDLGIAAAQALLVMLK